MMGLAQPVALIAHDAGAANHLLAWLAADKDADVRPYMEGPAAALWERLQPRRDLFASLEEAVAGAASVLTGSGWASDVEHRARRAARAQDIPCVAVIDHWTNYESRFERNGERSLPDAIWVTDRWAGKIAHETFPGLPVIEHLNIYLASEVERITSQPQGDAILYIGEPARDDWGRGEPGEFQSFNYFMERLEMLGLPVDAPVRLRPHPSEEPGKYDELLSRWPRAKLDDAPDLSSAIARASWVAGMQSYALVVALAAGRKVFSTLPSWAPYCALPHDEIIHLREQQNA